MPTLEPVTAQNALLFKIARLRALQDTPSAFGSTYAKEAQYSDDHWRTRASQWGGKTARCLLALDAGVAQGIAAGFLNRDDRQFAHLVSMWVAASHRRQGVGRMLVDAIVTWAAAQGAHTLQLHVSSDNEAATAFYRGLGFAPTGETEPHPNEPTLTLYEMSRPLADHPQ